MNKVHRWLCGFMERFNKRFLKKMCAKRKDWLFHVNIKETHINHSIGSPLKDGEVILLLIRDQNGEVHIPVKVTCDRYCDIQGTVHYYKLGTYLGKEHWVLANPRINETLIEGSLYVHFQYRELYSGVELTEWKAAELDRIR